MAQTNLSLAQQLSRFEAVLYSGFLIPDPAIVTALSLLFERVYFLNNLEFVIDFAKQFRFILPESVSIPEGTLQADHEIDDAPLSDLDPAQRNTVKTYLFLADKFFLDNALLFPDIFYCTLLPKGEVLSTELLKKNVGGGKNLYRVTKNPLVVSMEGQDELTRYIREGKVPILSNVIMHKHKLSKSSISASQAAASLALQSIAMVLPATKKAEAEVILEAREKLRNHLPPFWSAMLKLSIELQSKLDDKLTPELFQRECENTVTTIIRPALIDLVDKLEKERKSWFHRILSPISAGLGLLVGKPPMTPFELAATSLKLGTDMALDISKQVQKVESMKRETGLTYLLELHRVSSEKSLKPKRR